MTTKNQYKLKNGQVVTEGEVLIPYGADEIIIELLENGIPVTVHPVESAGGHGALAYTVGKIPNEVAIGTAWEAIELPVFRKPRPGEKYDDYLHESVNWNPYGLLVEEIMYLSKEIKLGAMCGMGEVILQNSPKESKRFIVSEVLRHLQIGGQVWIKRK